MFVVGAPRSGTTLFRRLLSAHPELEITHELRVLDLAAGVGWSALNGGQWPGPDAVSSPAALSAGWPLVNRLYRALGRRTGASVVGDKYPPDATRLPRLLRLVQQARVIHVIRDGRDVVSSSLRAFVEKAAWRRSTCPPTAADLAHSWVAHVATACRDGRPLGPRRYLEVRYESLTAHPAATCDGALAFLGLAPHAAVSAAAAEVHPGRRWADTLHTHDLSDACAVPGFSPLLADLGYDEPHTPGSSAPKCTLYRHLRLPEPSPDVVVEGLKTPGASLFSAMHARDHTEPEVRTALRDWMVDRGLPAHIAAALEDAACRG